jgi:ribonuclease R
MDGVTLLEQIAHEALRQRGLEPNFSSAALQQLERIHHPAGAMEQAVVDLRGMLWCSIDNDDSRDLDQLTYARPDGNLMIAYVAVADVDALVSIDTPLDQQAQINTTSIYTSAKIFPMLPEKLSTDLTSLNEKQERVAMIFEMHIDAEGIIQEYKIYRGLVYNHAQLAYSSVGAWLEGRAPAPPKVESHPQLAETIQWQNQIAQAIKAKRQSHGALTLETIELKAYFKENKIIKMEPLEHNLAHELIENLMIAANTTSARYMAEHSLPSLRRVVREPARWDRIIALALENGELLPGKPDSGALDRFLIKMQKRQPETFTDLSLAIVKLLGSGEYIVENPQDPSVGHFGLALRQYSHSTAPNRRYPDLITQRLLKSSLLKKHQPYTYDQLEKLAAHCTHQEDEAAKAERQVAKSAAAILLSNRLNETFDAYVTGASAKGTWVRLVKPPVEGKLVIGKNNLDVGDRLRVKLVSVDIHRGFIDFIRVSK